MLLDCSSNCCCMTLVRLELVELGCGGGGKRGDTSAKGPNKTVVSYSWANSQKQKAILMTTHTHIYIDPNTSLFQSIYMETCKCHSWLVANAKDRLQRDDIEGCLSFCFVFFSFPSENIFLRLKIELFSRSLVIILWDSVYFGKLTIYLLMSLGVCRIRYNIN